jgi:hypothetical protein
MPFRLFCKIFIVVTDVPIKSMNIRKAYRIQQQYYSGFSFVPMHSVQKHNYFFYKVYKSDPKLYQLFDSVLNKEVLENHFILTIRKAIINSSGPLTQAVTSDLDYVSDTVSRFFNESRSDQQEKAYVERTIRILRRGLGNFTEVEQKLTDDLTKLLSGQDFSGSYKINSDHIDNMLDVLHEVYKGIQRMLKRLTDFSDELSLNEDNHQSVTEARSCVNSLINALERWSRIHKTIIFQVQEWRAVRAGHERQEMLN